ncbi:trigger factor [Leptospira sp. GIMC2001]|uniref:trigger factor n=1 Tax=Leptospira sp. GIMC2001 TaxID=1513297 RepID=UPI00234AFDE8|nr:trigger factor [Leptospira sp. GIMC2001]WCL48511.1 trigger factor [Leptospira sp. GIMC2001]
MDYKTKKNNNATVDLTINFTSEELEKGFVKAYEKARNKVKVPGFRVGKAPIKTVEKMLGDSVGEDAINFVLQDAMSDLFPKLEFIPIRFPRFEVESFDRAKGFTAKATYDTRPEVTLPKYKKVKIEPLIVVPTDSDIQQEIDRIQKSMARNVLKEESSSVEAGNLIEMNYKFCLESEELPAKSNTGKYQLGDSRNPAGFDDFILGMKSGETKKFSFTYPANFEPSPESSGKTYIYEVTCTAIYTVTLPSIDDDLASEYDGSENLEALKSKLREDLGKAKTEELKTRSFQEIYNKLVDEAKFIIPESLIQEEGEHVYKAMFEQYKIPFVSMEEYAKNTNSTLAETQEKFKTMGLKRLQGYFLRHKIAEEEKLELSDEDLNTKLGEIAGAFGESVETFRKRLEKEGRIESIRENFIMEKVDNFVYEAVEKKNPKTISLADASKILNGENQNL